jgi:hypothetical protein
MARVKNGSETNTLYQGLHDTEMNFIINDGTSFGVVNRVDAFVVSVIFIAIQVFDLTTVTLKSMLESLVQMTAWTHQSSGGTGHRWAVRLTQASPWRESCFRG